MAEDSASSFTAHDGWYDLENEIFLDLINSPSSDYTIVLGNPSKTFVIPAVKDFFANQPSIVSTEDGKKKRRWLSKRTYQDTRRRLD